jgi:class 3 adenylate cyclase
MDPVVVSTSVDLDSSAKDVWPLITDTDRMNRIIGGQPVTYRPADGDGTSPARFVAETRTGGFRFEYEEFPFEWSQGRSFNVYRKMRSGVLASYAMSVELASRPGVEHGTRVTYRLQLVPRSWLLRPVVQLVGRRFVRSCAELAAAIDVHVRDKAASPYLKPVSTPNEAHIAFGLTELKKVGVPDAVAEKLAKLVREAPDADIVRVRPFEVADDWREDRREVLKAFLRAVPAGLVELRWALVCPSCRTASQTVASLDAVTGEGHCQLCDISFDLDLDRAVEATFVVHPSVRVVPDQMYCAGGPARTPHVVVQANVEAGGDRTIDAPDDAGRYRVFARGGSSASVEVEPDAPNEVELVLAPDAFRPPQIRVKPRGKLLVRNATDEARHVKVERLGYATQAATAHAVSTVGEFRSLFSSDLLKRGTPLKVARVAILFSDLTGSTALYSKVGDAAAFRLVDDHFDLMREVIDAHGGAVVKTMGDAVMAAFTDASDCIKAAVAALQRFEAFRGTQTHGADVAIKLGMFCGPCYVVTANGRLDYFGQTVNVASRVQHLAESGQLIVETSALDALRADARALVEAGERFESRVKGVDHALKLVRVTLSAHGREQSQQRVRAANG